MDCLANPLQCINNFLGNPVTQQAGTQTVDIASQATTITPIQTIGKLVELGAGAILIIGGLAFLVYLLMGGFNWITAGGDKGKVENARNMITQGVIGLAILASVFAVYGVVLRFLGIKSISIGSGGSGGSGSGGGSDDCVVGQRYNDGGAGGYCTDGGSAMVQCVDATFTNKIPYKHYEPYCCKSGTRISTYKFMGPDKCP